MMQGLFGSKVAGSWTIRVTFLRPVPSSLKAMYSVPATLPSLAAAPTFGPYRVP